LPCSVVEVTEVPINVSWPFPTLPQPPFRPSAHFLGVDVPH
jgi:hypothetical protein